MLFRYDDPSLFLMDFLNFRSSSAVIAQNWWNNQNQKPLKVIFCKVVSIKNWQTRFDFDTDKVSPA